MLLRNILIMTFVFTSFLHAKDSSWNDGISVKLEAGIFMNDLQGSVSNGVSSMSFEDELGYTTSETSYFGMEFKFDYDYVPNIDIGYFDVEQNRDSVLDSNKTLASREFSGQVFSKMEYSVFHILLYKDIKYKGSYLNFLRWKVYSGDIEYDLGVNVKCINYMIRIKDFTSDSDAYSYDRVNSILPMPYIGFKYFWYDFMVLGNVSAFSLDDTEFMSYQLSLDYRVLGNLYLSASYLYESFQALEKKDTVKFKTSGNKFSFKYKF